MKYECSIAGGIALYDVRDDLPTHPHKSFGKRTRPLRALFAHHSGRDNGRDGLRAIKPMASWHVYHKHWAAIGYHYAITCRPWPGIDGIVVCRVGADNTVRAHTMLCNKFSEGLVLQGHHGKDPLTDYQIEALEGFLPWWFERHGLDPATDLGWHSNSWKWLGVPKPACPGKYARAWLSDYVARAAA